MLEWCLEHPWMTFILLLTLFSGVRINIASGYWRKETQLEWRVHELEELLCPCEQHDWVETNIEADDNEKTVHYMCRKCKKQREEVMIKQ